MNAAKLKAKRARRPIYLTVMRLADPKTGELQKKEYGPWMLKAMRVLAKFRHLRGAKLDPFARSHDRKLDRELIAGYEKLVEEILAGLELANHETAVELASIPEQIRGFGHVRARYLAHARKREAALLDKFRGKAHVTDAAPARLRKVIPVFAS